MDINRAAGLRNEWKDKDCHHPNIEIETFSRIEDIGYIERETGDYVCTTCGEVVATSKEEYKNLIAEREKNIT